jgi:chromate transporter
LKLGFTAFGGPVAHVALMEEEIIVRRRWIDRQHFLDMIAAVNFIPGPNSTELAMHIGQLRAGTPGLIVAGACFIGPAMLIILPLAWMYVRFGQLPEALPVMQGIGAAVVAIIAAATNRFGHMAIRDRLTFTVMLAAVAVSAAGRFAPWMQPELVSLAIGATAGWLWSRRRRAASLVAAIALPPGYWPELARMAAVLLKIGATLFGSGYVLISYLQTDMVDHRGWLTRQELLDAIAVGQFTPGPLLTTSTFVGFLLGQRTFAGGMPGGIVGGIVATISIFLPSFLLVWLLGPFLQRLRASAWARGALDGMNAAVVGLMIVIAVRLAAPALYDATAHRLNVIGALVLAGTLIGLHFRINATWLIIAAGLFSWGCHALLVTI